MIGANMAPTYANLFVADMEEKHIYVSHHFRHVREWWRYIDDVFFIWSGTVSELNQFNLYLNSVDPDVDFRLKFSAESIQFLDTEVSCVDGKLCTKLYVKPTDKNTLLRFESAHPRRMIKSLPYSQLK